MMRGVLRRAWLDWRIGWHQGNAERAERKAVFHRVVETRCRREYRLLAPDGGERR